MLRSVCFAFLVGTITALDFTNEEEEDDALLNFESLDETVGFEEDAGLDEEEEEEDEVEEDEDDEDADEDEEDEVSLFEDDEDEDDDDDDDEDDDEDEDDSFLEESDEGSDEEEDIDEEFEDEEDEDDDEEDLVSLLQRVSREWQDDKDKDEEDEDEDEDEDSLVEEGDEEAEEDGKPKTTPTMMAMLSAAEDDEDKSGHGHLHFKGDWDTKVNEKQALKMGKKAHKPVMVIVTNSGCPHCQDLSKSFNKDKKINSLLEKFVAIHNPDSSGEDYHSDDEYVPRVYFYSKKGKLLHIDAPNSDFPRFFEDSEDLREGMKKALEEA